METIPQNTLECACATDVSESPNSGVWSEFIRKSVLHAVYAHDFVHCSAGYQCLVYSLALHCLRFHKFIVQSHIYCFAFCRLNFLLWLDLNLNSQWTPSGSRPMIV